MVVDFPLMLAFGLLYALLIRPEERTSGDLFRTRAFRHGLYFTLFSMAFVVVGYVVEPDWFLMYFWDGPRPGLLGLVFAVMFVYLVPFVAGFLSRVHLDALRIPLLSHGVTAVNLLAAYLIGWVFLPNRYLVAGSRDEFLAGTAKPLMAANSALSWLILLYLGGCVALWGYCYLDFRKAKAIVKTSAQVPTT